MVRKFNGSYPRKKSDSHLSLPIKVISPPVELSDSSAQTPKKPFIQRFYNLPISRKQWIALLASELVSILGIGIAGTVIITSGLRNQLVEQAKSEVVVTDINYNIKVNQMGFGFRGQSDNAAIIKAAQLHTSGKVLDANLKAEVKQILINEVKARTIEYATLVGKDFQIIVNANANREGEIFNPSNLVNEVFKNPQQIKATRIVSWSELSRESPPLQDGISKEDALIRYTVTPVKDPNTKVVIGALISGDIINSKDTIVRSTLRATGGGYSAIYMRKPTGEFALATALEQGQLDELNQSVANIELPPETKQSLLTAVVNTPDTKIVTGRVSIGKNIYTIAAKAIPNKIIEESDKQRIVFGNQPVAILVRGTPETTLNKLLEQSLIAELLIVFVALVIVFIWALILKRGIITPIEELQQTAQKFADGDRTSRCSVFATDEIGQLAVTFNKMADSIIAQASHQENEARLALQLNEITSRLRETLNSETIIKTAVNSLREVLVVDRLVFYRLQADWQATIIAESVGYEWPGSLGVKIHNPYLVREYLEDYETGMVKAVNNIHKAGLNSSELEQLEKLGVKAYLLAPIFVNKQLQGLLVAHQCTNQHQWRDIEINLFKQVAIQVGFALEQAELLRRLEQGRQNAETVSIGERQQKEALQLQILQLLNHIEGVTRGDLTVHADVKDGEIGTVADFFNSIVESLRLIVTKVKKSATQVNYAIASNEGAINQLAAEALTQAEEINHIQNAIDQMTDSIQSVAANARQAAIVAENASRSATESEQAIDLTVDNILAVRETVNETAKKIKHLGESTQEISRVVSLINQIALQTNLLAINAGIEANRAGDEGQGFAIVAEEVGELAARSAFATQEVEQIVTNIQRETNELVQTIEQGTSQVVEGTRIVTNAKQSLSQILHVSHQIDFLVRSISTAATSQVQTSQTVTQLIQEIAAVSQRTSTSSRLVSESLQQTVEISQGLQETVEMFKVS
ncbi:methyl-accepting chemotaxis protein [Fortiea contorta]|uniref:methyl-accepting chemotaxis protein n=1 Tax=Fortiea contorta TaxID=1892405 RepID=UPI00034CD95A|nr:methyl-accepting chemotaxis protein [Fortiea contorta]